MRFSYRHPSAMVSFMEKLLNASSVPTFLSDHTGTPERIKALKENISARQHRR